MVITIIGWVWLGILVGGIAGFMLCNWLTQSKINELESEITHPSSKEITSFRDTLAQRSNASHLEISCASAICIK